jgi:beta-glucosidase
MKILKQILRTIFIFALCKSCFAQTNQYPFQNPNLPAEERISNVISLMTLDEKINSLHFGAGVLRLGIPPMNSVEGLHGEELGGPARASRSATSTTIFPQEIGLGETWDPDILRQAAAVEGYEARYAEQSAKYHKGGLVIFSPNSDSRLHGRACLTVAHLQS